MTSACPRLGKGNLARWNPRLSNRIFIIAIHSSWQAFHVRLALKVLALLLLPVTVASQPIPAALSQELRERLHSKRRSKTTGFVPLVEGLLESIQVGLFPPTALSIDC